MYIMGLDFRFRKLKILPSDRNPSAQFPQPLLIFYSNDPGSYLLFPKLN
jgi:hypothetical protein